MHSRREFLTVLPAGLLGTAASSNLEGQSSLDGSGQIGFTPKKAIYAPLDQITIRGTGTAGVRVLDGDGIAYVDKEIALPHSFSVGGALGTQTVLLFDSKKSLLQTLSFRVDAKTGIQEASGEYQHLLDTLYWTMASDGPVGARRHNGRVYTYWVDWLLDNTNTMKGMRYFWPEVKQSFEIFSVTQREDGMIWENHIDRTPPESDWDRRFKKGDFSRPLDDGTIGVRRAPVENHVEMYFLEALYLAWKTTGDDAWMQQHLDAALRAVQYSTSDPYRWSAKYGLIKRGLTIDTWDFLCESEAALFGGDIMLVEPGKTHFGIFFGDNTGLIAGCRYLAEMLNVAGREQDAKRMRTLAGELEQRLNQLAWNGRFYTHWIPEDPNFKPDLGVDMAAQVSLSNSYTLNRGIAQGKAAAIIQSYQSIRKVMPKSSAGEWYSIYPPFLKGFGGEQGLWDYVNGGVLACTAGELARGCFEHGYEAYGADILARIHALTKSHHDFLPCILRGKEPERPTTAFSTIDLRAHANCDTGGGSAEVPGWVGEPGNNLIDFPSGKVEFRGVPFDLISPAENGRRVCVGISQAARYAASVEVKVDKRCRSFYLLHAGSGGGALFGKMTAHYTDGSTEVSYMERGVNLQSYWAPDDGEFNYHYGTNTPQRLQVAWRGKSGIIANVGVWITSFEIKSPNAALSKLVFQSSENGAKWFVLGVTVSDQPAYLPPRSDLSTGMPNNWGAGCMTAALLEGLCGIEDKGGGFRALQLSPRWHFAQVSSAQVTVRYPAGQGYAAYSYQQEGSKIVLQFASCTDRTLVRIPMPEGFRVGKAEINGEAAVSEREEIGSTTYVVLPVRQRGAHRLTFDLVGA